MRIGVLAATAAILLGLAPYPVSADFLGLAPGDYDVVLLDSAALCGGGDCEGTVHIPADNTNLLADFDWSFEIGGVVFDWTPPGLGASVSPNGLNSCATEGGPGTTCAVTDSGSVTTLNEPPFLTLSFIGGTPRYAAFPSSDVFDAGAFTATPRVAVYEPTAGILLLIGVATWAGVRPVRKH